LQLEGLGVEARRQRQRQRVEHAHRQVRLPGGRLGRLEHRRQALEVRRRGHRQRARRRVADRRDVGRPVEARHQRGQPGEVGRVVHAGDVAALDAGLGEPGQRGLERHHVGGEPGRRLALAGEREHRLEVRHVRGARRGEAVALVVVAIGQAEPGGVEHQDRGARVAVVGLGAVGPQRGDLRAVQRRHRGAQAARVLGLGDVVEQRLHAVEAALLDRRGVEARRVVVAELLRDRVGRRGGGLVEDRALGGEVALAQLAEAAPARSIGRDRVGGQPAAARELEEVAARVGGAVERAGLEADVGERHRDGRWAGRARGAVGRGLPAAGDESGGADQRRDEATDHRWLLAAEPTTARACATAALARITSRCRAR
jgi:hypothetical protein